MVVAASGCDPGAVAPTQSGHGDASVSAVVTMDSPAATRAFLDALRARFQPAASDKPTPSPLPATSVDEVRLENGWVVPHLADDAFYGVHERADVLLPQNADGALRITEPSSGVALEVGLASARPSAAETAGGYVVYRNANEGAVDLLHRVTASGNETTVHFSAQPDVPYVELQVQLGEHVGGLRLVDGGRAIEILDKGAALRMRLASPTLLDGNGVRHDAILSVDGCIVDHSAAPSKAGKKSLTVVNPGLRRCTVGIGWEKAVGVAYPALLQLPWRAAGDVDPNGTPVQPGKGGVVPTPQPNAGTPCMNAGQCMSGFCVDGYCCNSACNAGGCQKCNVAGVEGTCTTVPVGQPGGCSPYVCKGANTCGGWNCVIPD